MDRAAPELLKMKVEERDRGWGIQIDIKKIKTLGSQLDSDM